MILKIKEHEKIYISKTIDFEKNRITEKELKFLRDIEYTTGSQIFKWGKDYITPQQWVGIIKLPTFSIEILPKVDSVSDEHVNKKIFINMLAYINDFNNKYKINSSMLNSGSDFLEIMINMFLSLLRSEVQFGLIKSYVKEEKNIGKMKGKIIFTKHIQKNIVSKEKFYCRYSTLTPNNHLNHIIYYVLFLLKKISKSSLNIKNIQGLESYFSEVDLKKITIEDIKYINWTALNIRYKEVVKFCELFLSYKFLNLGSSANNIEFFLFDMNKLFEKVIASAMKKISKDIHLQYNKQYFLMNKHSGRKKIKLKPDIVMEHQDKKILIDTKWKEVKGFISESDAYQMAAYNQTFNSVAKVLLLYPKSKENDKIIGEYQFINFKEFNDTLVVKTVDLTKILDKKDFHNYVKSLIN